MLQALVVSLMAGLATSVGGLLVITRTRLERPWLAVSLAFSSGAMLLVSFMEILPLGVSALGEAFGSVVGQAVAYLAFFAGIAVVMTIDRLLPNQLNPNETEGLEPSQFTDEDRRRTTSLLRSGILVAVVLGLHNFPEGMATFLATYTEPAVGLTLAVAIAIHNIPEGIAVAAPVYAATKSRHKAFWWATLSGLTEPLGALVAAALIAWVIPASLLGIVFGLVAGMMVFLALDELLPGAWRYQTDKHQTVYGMLAGMLVVAVSLVLFSL